MARILGPVSVCLFLQCAAAWAYPDLDWKLYDGLDGTGKKNLCFYEERSIVHMHGHIVHVWTKCVSRSALDAAGANHLKAPYSQAVAEMSVSRRTYGYALPILSAETLDKKHVIAAIRYEAVADVAGLAPESTMLHEIDCRGHRVRLISGTTGTRSLPPSGWTKMPAGGPDARLRRLLCP
ncbi:MAG TPA: hypothetical protein VKR31_08170 [Rhizomicrobium sp.]|nr:hypothetical protein [Rhizomicrobium sp.]